MIFNVDVAQYGTDLLRNRWSLKNIRGSVDTTLGRKVLMSSIFDEMGKPNLIRDIDFNHNMDATDLLKLLADPEYRFGNVIVEYRSDDTRFQIVVTRIEPFALENPFIDVESSLRFG